MVKLENIQLSFENNLIFDNLSYTFVKNKVYLLEGKSGLGKSSLAKLIAGHISPSAGKISLAGLNITSRPNSDIILVHQEDDLFPWLRVHDQIKLALRQDELGDKSKPLLAALGLCESIHLWPHQLSGGMKKRLALGRALLANPKMLILDETFSALDQQTRFDVYQKLKQSLPEGIILLFISHDDREMEIFSAKRLTIKDRLLVEVS